MDASHVTQRSYWSRSRGDTVAWLRRLGAQSLADLYETAVDLLEASRPGYIRLVSHAVREIANSLPRKMNEAYERGRLEYPKHLKGIREAWPSPPMADADRSIDIPVPQKVVALWRGLLDADSATTARIRRNAVNLFIYAEVRRTGRRFTPAEVEAAVAQWLTLIEWFQKNVHEGEEEAPVDATIFRERFVAFERTLTTFYEQHFRVRGELDDLLARTNTRSG